MISISILHSWALLIKFSNAFAPKGFHKPFPWRSSLPNRFLGGSGSTSTSIPSCSEVNGTPLNEYKDFSTRDSFNLIVMGDLHLEDDMKSHEEARDDCIDALKQLSLLPSPPVGKNPLERDEINADALINQMKKYPAGDLSETQLEMLLEHKRQGQLMNCHLISLGDLGRKDIRHEPGDAGTTKSFVDAKEFLDSFQVPFDLVTGNHDLEGLDEFDSDEENLQAWMSCFRKDVPYFSKQVGEKTLLVGLSTVRFRDAPHSSHECHVDDEQLEWFRDLVEEHSHYDGWRILVFTHAPIMGSNLRVLQNVHVVNGCAWMNHCSPPSIRSSFIEIVKQSPQIKLWSSGHFHLSHEFEDSLSRVNQCTFMQVGVVGKKSTRDHTRQTRIVQGNSDTLKIYTINHHLRNEDGKADMRLDASIDLVQGEMYLYASKKDVSHSECKNDQWFGAYVPQEEDGCYVESPSGRIASEEDIDEIGEFVPMYECIFVD